MCKISEMLTLPRSGRECFHSDECMHFEPVERLEENLAHEAENREYAIRGPASECPFCGSESVLVVCLNSYMLPPFQVRCNCGARGGAFYIAEKALEEWRRFHAIVSSQCT